MNQFKVGDTIKIKIDSYKGSKDGKPTSTKHYVGVVMEYGPFGFGFADCDGQNVLFGSANLEK